MNDTIKLKEFEVKEGMDLPEILRCTRTHGHDRKENLTKAGHKVGAGWSGSNPATPVIVTPKFPHLNPVTMLQSAWPEVSAFMTRPNRTDKKLFDFHATADMIPVRQATAPPFLLFFVALYLKQLHPLLPRMRKRDYRYSQANLTQRVRGRIVFHKHVKHNLTQGRQDRVFCEYPELVEDNPLNQILKAALHRCQQLIQDFPGDTKTTQELANQISSSLRQLANVKALNRPQAQHIVLARRSASGVFLTFREALEIALNILRITGETGPTGDNEKEVQVPPFAIDMELLFELYVRHLVKQALPLWKEIHRDREQVYFADSLPPENSDVFPWRQPDLVMESPDAIDRLVVEVKYELFKDQDWLTTFQSKRESAEDTEGHSPRRGFFQVVAYMQLYDCTRGCIICPSTGASNSTVGTLGVRAGTRFGVLALKKNDTDDTDVSNFINKLCPPSSTTPAPARTAPR